ncbi:MAG: tetratricopeptide repeat protein [Deltaproteobacteria bacterium]|nr:tetratricopeptide repeat protein [Deltaproteobacteria bacterium]
MIRPKTTRKELLKSPDEFLSLSERTALFVREHSRQFSYLGIGIAAALFLYLAGTTYLGYVNRKGQEAFNTAYRSMSKAMEPSGNQEDLDRTRELFAQVASEYGLSKASRLVPPEMAYIRFREKNYDEAIALYGKFLKDVPRDSPYQGLGELALAACYEEKGDFAKSVETLKQILARPKGLFHEQAMLSLARVYRLAHEEQKANETLKEFLRKFAGSSFVGIARAQLKE